MRTWLTMFALVFVLAGTAALLPSQTKEANRLEPRPDDEKTEQVHSDDERHMLTGCLCPLETFMQWDVNSCDWIVEKCPDEYQAMNDVCDLTPTACAMPCPSTCRFIPIPTLSSNRQTAGSEEPPQDVEPQPLEQKQPHDKAPKPAMTPAGQNAKIIATYLIKFNHPERMAPNKETYARVIITHVKSHVSKVGGQKIPSQLFTTGVETEIAAGEVPDFELKTTDVQFIEKHKYALRVGAMKFIVRTTK